MTTEGLGAFRVRADQTAHTYGKCTPYTDYIDISSEGWWAFGRKVEACDQCWENQLPRDQSMTGTIRDS